MKIREAFCCVLGFVFIIGLLYATVFIITETPVVYKNALTKKCSFVVKSNLIHQCPASLPKKYFIQWTALGYEDVKTLIGEP